MIHDIWLIALRNKSTVWTERVGSNDNLSDLPSRQSYDPYLLMRALHGQLEAPKLPEARPGERY